MSSVNADVVRRQHELAVSGEDVGRSSDMGDVMGVYVRGKTVETDRNIYEFADLLAAESFINCLCGMDEERAKARVKPVRVNRKPQPTLWRSPGVD